MGNTVKPSRSIRSPKVTGKISKTALRGAIKKVTQRRTDSNEQTHPEKKLHKKPDSK